MHVIRHTYCLLGPFRFPDYMICWSFRQKLLETTKESYHLKKAALNDCRGHRVVSRVAAVL